MINQKKLEIQELALNSWRDNKGIGTLEIITQVGKTFIGLMAIHKMELKDYNVTNIVICPSVKIKEHWIKEKEKYSELFNYQFKSGLKIYTINEVINLIKTGLFDKDIGFQWNLLILDEIDQYGGMESINIFSYIKYKYILGLTACFERIDGRHKIISQYCPVIFKYNSDQASDDQLIASYGIVNIEVIPENRVEIDKISSNIGTIIKRYGGFDKINEVVKRKYPINQEFFDCVSIYKLINKRKELVYNDPAKLKMAFELIQNHKNDKIIMFFEYDSSLLKMCQFLSKNQVDYVEYSSKSGLTKKQKDAELQRFIDNEVRILLCIKSLNRGFSVKDINVAIIMAGNSSSREMIQRIGRTFTKENQEDIKNSTIYQIICSNTIEESWMNKRSKNLK